MKLKGLLRDLSGLITGQSIEPTLGLDSDGGIFTTIVNTTAIPTSPTAGAFVTDTITIGVASTEIIPAQANTYFAIYNLGAETVFLQFGGAATVADFPLLPGAFYEPLAVPTNQVTGIVAAATENVFVFTL